jgi:molybdate transport system substrate-binding protein
MSNRTTTCALVLIGLAVGSCAGPAPPAVRPAGSYESAGVARNDNGRRVDVLVAGEPFSYVYPTSIKKPVLFPLPESVGAIKILCSNGFKAVMEELASDFERATKHRVAVSYGLAAALKRRIESGESFDLAVLTSAATDDLIKEGKIVAASRTPLARTGLALAIRAGAPKPDISTVDAFKRSLLDAKSIAYAKEGASGVAFAALIQQLGIADDLKAKCKLTATGDEVGQMVVRGEAEFGVLPVSEILPVRGAELLGTFPDGTESYVTMVAGVSSGAKQGNAAMDLIGFLKAPGALPVIKAKGMERDAGSRR